MRGFLSFARSVSPATVKRPENSLSEEEIEKSLRDNCYFCHGSGHDRSYDFEIYWCPACGGSGLSRHAKASPSRGIPIYWGAALVPIHRTAPYLAAEPEDE